MKLVKIFSLLILVSLGFSQEILKEKQRQILDLQKEKVQSAASAQQNSWISPFIFSYTYSKDGLGSEQNLPDTNTQKGTVSISQDVFRSGGILNAIFYANSLEDEGLFGVDLAKNNLNAAAYELLAGLKTMDLEEQKLRLAIENSSIDIKRKREQFVAGLVDVSFLNSAILSKTTQQNQLLAMLSSKESLELSFNNLSDKDYKTFEIPDLKVPNKQEFLDKNLEILQKQSSSGVKKALKNMTLSKYLPKVSVNAYYNKFFNEPRTNKEESNYGYGLSVSMPLNLFTSFSEVEASKLDYLVTQNELALLKETQDDFYDVFMQDIKRIDEKIALAKQDIELYDELLKQTKEQVLAGLKTDLDLKTMQNSKQIRSIDQKIYTLDKFKKILSLQKKYLNAF